MSLIAFVVLGVAVGLLARALFPDRGLDSMGAVPAALVGSFAGGVLVSLLEGIRWADVSSANIVGSLSGALTALVVSLAVGSRVDV